MTGLADLVIRPATPEDAGAIALVHVETWRATYAGMIPDRVLVGMSEDRQAAHWTRWFRRPGGEFALVAELRGFGDPAARLVGFASGGGVRTVPGAPPFGAPALRDAERAGRSDRRPGRAPKPADAPRLGEVFTLYVLPDLQGQGIGRRLLAQSFRALCDAGYGAAVIWVLAANPARFFYEAAGGQRIAEQQEHLWGTQLPEYAYGWPDLDGALDAGLVRKARRSA